MALGGAFIVLVLLLCWRRRMRRKRAARTAQFAEGIQRRGFFVRSFQWLGGKLFNRRTKEQDVDGMVTKMRAEELERHHHQMEMLDSRTRTGTSFVSQQAYGQTQPVYGQTQPAYERSLYDIEQDPRRNPNRLSAPSIYSQVTGVPRTVAEPRLPMRDADIPPMPREFNLRRPLSNSTDGSSMWASVSQRGEQGQVQRPQFYDTAPLQPQRYETAPLQPRYHDVATEQSHRRDGSVDSYATGDSGSSERLRTNPNNPFRHNNQ